MPSIAHSNERAADPVPSTNTGSRKPGIVETHFIKWMLVLLLVAVVSYTSISYTRFKFARSEIAYAEMSKEMLHAKSYIVTLYRHEPCIDKPIWNFWTIIPSFALFGITDFTARIPSLLASLACLTIYALAMRKLLGGEVALLSTIILATASRYWEFSTLCMTDMWLTLFDLVTLACLYASLKTPQAGKKLLLYAIAAVTSGCAVLDKGPVGLILPGISFFIYVTLTKNWKNVAFKQVALAGLAFAATAGPWYVLAGQQTTGGSTMGAYFWHHNIERFFGSAYEWHHDPLYMVQALFNGFVPWCVFLPVAAISAIKNYKQRAQSDEFKFELYCWIWLCLTTTFFTLSHGKMNYYDLPAFTAASAIVGLHLNRWIQDKSVIAKIGGWLFAAFFIGGGFIAAALLPGVTDTNDFASICMMPIGLLVVGGLTIIALRRKHYFAPYVLAGAAMAVTLISFSIQVHPAMAKQAPALEYIQTIKQHPLAKTALHADFGTTVDWFDVALFYTDRVPVQLDTPQDMEKFFAQKDEAMAIIPENRFDELPESVRKNLTVLENRPYMYEKNDVGFLFKRHGHLMGKIHLLLVSNKPQVANAASNN